MCTGPIFLTKNVFGIYNMNPLFQKRFIHCAMVIPFILHWPSLFFSKVGNSQKKVLITPGLYFPNYCVTYLSCDISRDFKKCEHVNLRREWTLAVLEELYYTANDQKMADKKKAYYQEGLEKSRADSAARSRDSYMRDPEKSCARSCKSYKNNLEKSCDDSAAWSCESYLKVPQKRCAQNHESYMYMNDPEESCWQCSTKPQKLTRKTWRRVAETKLAWLYPTKVRKQLQSNRLS